MAKALGIDRTARYRKPAQMSARNRADIAILRVAHALEPRYGVRRLAIYLGWSENKTRRIRILADVTISRPRRKYRGYKANPEIATPANHLHGYAVPRVEGRPQDGMDYRAMTQAKAWVQDFTYIRIGAGMFYLALVMELKTRRILSWRLGSNHSSQLTHSALTDALRKHAPPRILHSDQGSEYLSERHQKTCEFYGINLSASRAGAPWQNGFMERFMRTLKEELGPLSRIHNLEELFFAVTQTIYYYNHIRIHTELKMSPVAYATGNKQALKFGEIKRDRVLQEVGA